MSPVAGAVRNGTRSPHVCILRRPGSRWRREKCTSRESPRLWTLPALYCPLIPPRDAAGFLRVGMGRRFSLSAASPFPTTRAT